MFYVIPLMSNIQCLGQCVKLKHLSLSLSHRSFTYTILCYLWGPLYTGIRISRYTHACFQAQHIIQLSLDCKCKYHPVCNAE